MSRHSTAKLSIRLCVASLLISAAAIAHAGVYRLDDSLTHAVPANAQMQWRELRDGGGMETRVQVNVHINLRDWQGRQGRIYMLLAPDEASPIEAVWRGGARLRDGRLRSGERTLVYVGTLDSVALTDQIVLDLRAGNDWSNTTRRLQFSFELETD